MDIKDRLLRGFTSGLIAGAVQDVFDYFSYSYGLNKLRYIDWAGIMIFNRKASNLQEALLVLGVELFFSAIIGVLFAYLIPHISSRNFLFKGWLFGVSVWFSLYGIMKLFKVKGLQTIDFGSALSDLITASIYGIALSLIFGWLDKRLKTGK